MDRPVVVVAVAVAAGEAVPVLVETVVDDRVAVLVHAVAALGRARVDVGRQIVAVAGAARPGVGVVVEALVHLGVAVVVDRVAELVQQGGAQRVVVVAVAVADPRAVAVAVRLVRGHDAVAVVVDAVAGLAQRGCARGVGVVAVALAAHLSVAVRVGLVRGQRVVAVVVDAVAGLGEGRGPGRVLVVAVAVAAPLPVAVGVELVHRHDGVAVVVLAVADLDRRGVGGRVRVVAVAAAGCVAVRVRVEALVDVGVAVVVEAVADLGGHGVDRGVGVVAVAAAGCVAVRVRVEALVDVGVAVVVDVVADLGGGRADRGVAVVAVAAAGGVGVAVGVEALVDVGVAVVVEAVADLGGRGVDRGVGVDAVAVADHRVVAVSVHLVRRRCAIAVVVDLVAGLGQQGGAQGVGVVAVELTGGAVAVRVGAPARAHAQEARGPAAEAAEPHAVVRRALGVLGADVAAEHDAVPQRLIGGQVPLRAQRGLAGGAPVSIRVVEGPGGRLPVPAPVLAELELEGVGAVGLGVEERHLDVRRRVPVPDTGPPDAHRGRQPRHRGHGDRRLVGQTALRAHAVILEPQKGARPRAHGQVQIAVLVRVSPGAAALARVLVGGPPRREHAVLVGVDPHGGGAPVPADRDVQVAVAVHVPQRRALGGDAGRQGGRGLGERVAHGVRPVGEQHGHARARVAHHDEVVVAVAVELSPARVGQRGEGLRVQVGEPAVAVVLPDIDPPREDHRQIQVPIPVLIAPPRGHGRVRRAVAGVRDGEGAGAVVEVHPVDAGVFGHGEVEVPVAVRVREAQAPRRRPGHPRPGGHPGRVRVGVHPVRGAVDRDAQVQAVVVVDVREGDVRAVEVEGELPERGRGEAAGSVVDQHPHPGAVSRGEVEVPVAVHVPPGDPRHDGRSLAVAAVGQPDPHVPAHDVGVVAAPHLQQVGHRVAVGVAPGYAPRGRVAVVPVGAVVQGRADVAEEHVGAAARVAGRVELRGGHQQVHVPVAVLVGPGEVLGAHRAVRAPGRRRARRELAPQLGVDLDRGVADPEGQVQAPVPVHVAPGGGDRVPLRGRAPARAVRGIEAGVVGRQPAVVLVDDAPAGGVGQGEVHVAVAVEVREGQVPGVPAVGRAPENRRGEGALDVLVDARRRVVEDGAQVQVPVAVDVAPSEVGGARGRGRGRGGGGLERALFVVEDHDAAVVLGDGEVGEAVAIDVAPGHVPAVEGGARSPDQGEGPVAVVGVDAVGAVDGQGDVEIAVPIEVRPGARAHRGGNGGERLGGAREGRQASRGPHVVDVARLASEEEQGGEQETHRFHTT